MVMFPQLLIIKGSNLEMGPKTAGCGGGRQRLMRSWMVSWPSAHLARTTKASAIHRARQARHLVAPPAARSPQHAMAPEHRLLRRAPRA
jgi:hypothetical protein